MKINIQAKSITMTKIRHRTMKFKTKHSKKKSNNVKQRRPSLVKMRHKSEIDLIVPPISKIQFNN